MKRTAIQRSGSLCQCTVTKCGDLEGGATVQPATLTEIS